VLEVQDQGAKPCLGFAFQREESVMPSARGKDPCGRTDCVVITCEPGSSRGLVVLQVIEQLTYYREDEKVDIVLDVFTEHRGHERARYRIVHRGWVTGHLHTSSIREDGDEGQELFSKLYAGRIDENPDDPTSLLFYRRVNCLGKSLDATVVSLAGPGRCFDKLKDGARLEPEIPTGPGAAFTSFIIPPPQCGEIMPGESAVCRIKLSLSGETYRRFIRKGRFSVDSYSRLLRQIETEDLQHADEDQADLFNKTMRSREAVIRPLAYDILICQHPGGEVDLEDGSISITPVPIRDERLRERALWFFGEPEEFNLRLCYRKRGPNTGGRAARQREKMERRPAKRPVRQQA
jgi:hypothetical protein